MLMFAVSFGIFIGVQHHGNTFQYTLPCSLGSALMFFHSTGKANEKKEDLFC